MKHMGVKIWKEKVMIPGSDMKELKDGRIVPCKPQYEVSFRYAGSCPYETLQECKESIERVWNNCCSNGVIDQALFEKVMNTDHRKMGGGNHEIVREQDGTTV